MLVGLLRRGLGGRDAQDDVEACGKLAELGILDELEIRQQRFAGPGVANRAKDAIAVVLGVAPDVKLGREQFPLAALQLHMYMRRAPGIGDRLDRPEAVSAVAGRYEASVALEALVAPL